MSHAQVENLNTNATKKSVKVQPYDAVPVVLGIIMLNPGGFKPLLVQAIKIFSSMG